MVYHGVRSAGGECGTGFQSFGEQIVVMPVGQLRTPEIDHTFGAVLGRHVDAGAVTVKQMCDRFGGSEQTWYRTINGERSPAWDVVADNFETLPEGFQADLLRQLLRKTASLRVVTAAGEVPAAKTKLLERIEALRAAVTEMPSAVVDDSLCSAHRTGSR